VSELEKIDEAFAEGKTEKEIQEAIDAAMVEDSLSNLEKFRRDNPPLQDAWDQVKTIRALTEKRDPNDVMPKWQRNYNAIRDGIETDNEALRDAWNKYYVLKELLGK
jgi:hypothetical protein